ncbi:putative intracellular protease/amidase [Streptomyces sp. CEV 2-1]|uniref:DJ-1/PfpI family protein n=1 Tax=Streptomyces sp. CEV 2-1 TaxID=2485153 RepID=UPI000F4A4416|nr:DJ-1/PfpI family protein [Streptomyces sp. CEV 2-1]ROQ81061.1 putative intracellular protease/amidase [Streptomyces sp. CEV 2-1]
MTRRTVYLAVYDTYADWETGHTTAHLAQHGFTVRTVGPTTDPVTSMGGLTVRPDLALAELRPEDGALLILPGAGLWDAGNELAPFARAARTCLDAGVPVAAICGATAGLAREGLLDERAHTSAVSFYLAATGYGGGKHYVDADAVTDHGRAGRDGAGSGGAGSGGAGSGGALVTAGPTEPVAFAREILALLGVFEGEKLNAWYRLFHDSDASAYEVLQG